MRGGLRGPESAMGLGRGRTEGWQRGGESSREGSGIGPVRGGRSGILGGGILGGGILGGGILGGGILGGGRGGIAGNGIGPLTLVAGAKKFFQNVSGDALNGIPAIPHDANPLTGRALPYDCTTTNGR
jgi:hypothetical protein